MKEFCNICKGLRNHKSITEYKNSYNNNDEGIHMDYSYEIITCDGCESISYKTTEIGSESTYDGDGNPIKVSYYYPKREYNTIGIKSFYNTPIVIRKIYRETIDAYNNNLYILCAGGLRAIIEAICKQEKILGGTLEVLDKKGKKVTKIYKNLAGRISGMKENGLITKKHSEILHEHRYLGNEALHELLTPSQRELKLAIDIIEQTLENIYEMDEKVEDLKNLRNRRKKNSKTA